MNTKNTAIHTEQWQSFSKIYRHNKKSHVRYWFYGLLAALLIILFLPWTQNIRARGGVTTLRQEQRPQQLNTIIPGRIAKWHVKEGDQVQTGDTILQLAEIKDDYLDPQLLSRTQEQLSAKQITVDYYKNKVSATGTQISALSEALQLKLNQLKNKLQQLQLKVQSDSMEVIAAHNEFTIAARQFSRQKAMYDSGLVSLTQLEQRNQSYQNALAKKVGAENKLANTRQDLTITRIEMNATQQDYMEKIAKAQGERFQSLSQIASSQGDIAKLQNQYSNYNIRSGLYYITAPQSGQVVKAKKAGIGEIVKEGEMIVEIVPDSIQYAVEIFVRPVDLPLISTGQKVRFMFDGFPAIVFSGWPNSSYGTFGGKVTAVEGSVSINGKFRVLVTEDPADKPWPKELKMGTGAQGMALLKNVPVWYELWRNINGFPPDYYKPSVKTTKE
ncbi:MAG: HlyD family efflux transporter periplasmic adaptor subunit [Chitinophagaceae bacterium]|nr:HlyD family efflux transporter periplasmic adaptor subunit [Chitinophagaceae bacterium]